jgi:epoxyqueuosine reductase
MDGWVFGCDICQDVCPWNKFSNQNDTPELSPTPHFNEVAQSDWQELTEDVFKRVFKKSAVKRAGLIKLKQNIHFAKE